MPPKPSLLALNMQMQKAGLLCCSLFITLSAFSQKKANPKTDKSETEITAFILADNYYVTFGAQCVFRLPVTKMLKVGAGVCTEPLTM